MTSAAETLEFYLETLKEKISRVSLWWSYLGWETKNRVKVLVPLVLLLGLGFYWVSGSADFSPWKRRGVGAAVALAALMLLKGVRDLVE